MPTDSDNNPIVIVGGGWSGLAAAVTLTSTSNPVVLLEASGQMGGRARRLMIDNFPVDNGQHIMLGAYHEFSRLLKLLAVNEREFFYKFPLHLSVKNKNMSDADITTSSYMPAPLHMLAALFLASGLSMQDKLSAIRFCIALFMRRFSLHHDISVAELCKQHKQTANIIKVLWEPICLAALNTPIKTASARIFLNTLKKSFTKSRKNSTMLVPKTDIGQVFPDPACSYVIQQGGRIMLNSRVTSLEIDTNQIKSVVLKNGEKISCKRLILACPHEQISKLIRQHENLKALAIKMGELGHAPICTIYLKYPEFVSMDTTFTGYTGVLVQWLFDRRYTGQPGLMAAVISADGPHMELNNEDLATQVIQEINEFHPEWPLPQVVQVIREKRATFLCSVNCQEHRPTYSTPVKGIYIAGDAADNGLPATLEGAIINGIKCANLAMA